MRIALVLVALTVVPVLAAPGLDRNTQKRIEAFGVKWWKARPATKFEEWDEQTRAALLREAADFGPIGEGDWLAVRDALWKSVKKYGPKGKPGAKLTIESPYGPLWAFVGGKGSKGKGLILGLHGGGKGAGSASEPKGTWQHKSCMGLYPQGLVLTGDNWNTVHGEKHILTLIEIAKAQYDIDPDRVYSMGFSMGGTGSWHMAGRFPDLLAGAAPCAGVVMARPKSAVPTKEEVVSIQYGIVPNVRNLAMYYFIGLEDRNCPPGTYLFVEDVLKELRGADPEGYSKVRFKSYPGLAHAMPPGEPGNCINWLMEQKRDAYPTRIVWEYAYSPYPLPEEHDKTRRFVQRCFYWIRCDHPMDRMEIVAEREGNEFDFSFVGAEPEGAYLLLNPAMIDVKADVVVRLDGEEIYRGKPEPTFRDVVESLDARLDKTLVFDRNVPLWKE